MQGRTLGLVGARGYTGAEFLRLLDGHDGLELVFASSRELAGSRVCDAFEAVDIRLEIEALEPQQVAQRAADICVLALPNGLAAPYVEAIERHCPDTLIVDLSADYRFDPGWYYGLPELTRERAPGQRRISNPGCYATAMQLAIAPVSGLLAGPVTCFGVSGYSGAGTTPSPRNDPKLLRDNLLPYAPVNHVHEREVRHHIGQAIRFMPHVASFFRGISMTVCASLSAPCSLQDIAGLYRRAYSGEPLVRLGEQPPLVADNSLAHHAAVGGWTLGEAGDYLVVYATLDNLLKGAATQAMQNINLACGFEETEGIPLD